MSVRVYWLDCRKVDPAKERVRRLMSPRRREKIAAIRDENGRRQSAAAELALVLALAQERGGQVRMVKWETLPGGKPVLDDGLYVSLAHSGDMAVCAVFERDVGVDVEAPRDVPAAMRRKVYSSAEQERPDRMLRWTWVAKESYLKMTGEGISRAMNGFAAEEGAIMDMDGSRMACVRTAPDTLPGYILCVCAADMNDVELTELQW